MNTAKLRGKMAEMSVTQDEMAKLLGMALSTFNRKFNAEGGDTFTVGDALKMFDRLSMSTNEAEAIFFGNDVA